MSGVGIELAPSGGYGAVAPVDPLNIGSLGAVPGPLCCWFWEKKRPGA